MQNIVGEYSIVSKVDVSDLEESFRWYSENLDLVPQPQFDVPNVWRQLKFSDIENISVGLNYNPTGIGTGGAVLTIVVQDIITARQQLISRGIQVSNPVNVGQGVILAFFKDPDGNQLGLRQQK